MLGPEAMRMPGWRGGDGNASYLDKTLRHHGIELGFDESVSLRFIVQLFFRAFIMAAVVYCGVLILSIFFILVLLADGDVAGATMVFWLGQFVPTAVFFLVLLATRLPEPIAEWRVLLADRQDGADAVYSQIAGTLRNRRIPLRIEVARIQTGMGPAEVGNRLILRDGYYDAYVSVFGYGTSLYLGWMMWRSRRGYQLIWQFVVDVISGIQGRSGPEHQMMRTERPRAMREAVHAACREGLFVGIERRRVPVAFGFPHGLPPVQSAGRMPDAPPPPGSLAQHPPPVPQDQQPPPQQ